jgi:fatty acid desaturase
MSLTATPQRAPARTVLPSSNTELVRLAYRLTSDLSKPNAAIYWTDLLLSAALGYGGLALWYVYGMTFVGLAAVLVSALALYRCVLFIHELTHLRRRTPRFFWTAWHVLVGVPMLLPSFLYEGVHNLHHAKEYYGTENDPEYLQFTRGPRRNIAYMLPISASEPLMLVVRFLFVIPIAVVVPAIRGYVLERMSAMMMNPRFRRKQPPPYRTAWLVLEGVTSVYAWAILILVLAGVVPFTLVLMWLAVWSAISVINIVRTLAAHHYENDGQPIDVVAQLLDSVNVPPPAMLPMLWAPVGLRYHALHHLLPNLPYHSLGAAHRRLLAQLPADSPYRATASRRVAEVLARMLRMQARHRKAASTTAPGEPKVLAPSR